MHSPEYNDELLNNIVSRLQDLVSNKFEINKGDIHPDALFVEDIGVDSLEMVEIMAHLEESVGIVFSDTDIEKCNSVQGTARVLCLHIRSQGKNKQDASGWAENTNFEQANVC